MQRKIDDYDEYEKLQQQRSDEVQDRCRVFSTYLEMVAWPENEVILFLRSRS